MEWYFSAAIVFGSLLLVLALGVPVPFALGTVGLIGVGFLYGWRQTEVIALTAWHWGTLFSVICLPLYVLMAEFLIFAGAADDVFDAAQKWLNRVPGSLAVASIMSCGVFAAIVGGSTVNAAAIGSVAVPQMMKRGYDARLATGCVAAGGTLGILIPPSALMIVYAILTEQSIGQLFLGGIIPGIILVIMFSLYVIVRVLRNPSLAPPMGSVSWKERLVSLNAMWPILVIVFLVLGTIYLGICTATESAALGSVGAIIVALVYRRSDWASVRDALLRTMRLAGFVSFIVLGAMAFVHLITRLEVPANMADWISSLGLSSLATLVSINVFYIFLGCFIDPVPILALTMSVVFPIMMNAGFDPVWFGVMVTINMEMANITPPVGLNLFVLKSIAPEVNLSDILWGALPFCIFLSLAIVLITAFPDLVMYLPKHMIRY